MFSRRSFLKRSGATAGALTVTGMACKLATTPTDCTQGKETNITAHRLKKPGPSDTTVRAQVTIHKQRRYNGVQLIRAINKVPTRPDSLPVSQDFYHVSTDAVPVTTKIHPAEDFTEALKIAKGLQQQAILQGWHRA